MAYTVDNDLGFFEGFNFKTQSAIDKQLTAEDVINWDHDEQGEAEFWPEGGNVFVKELVNGNCTGNDLLEIDRIFSELHGCEYELCKALYMKSMHGSELEQITRDAIDDECLYVYGPNYFSDLAKEAAWDLFENLYPEACKLVESYSVPGLSFDEEDFLRDCSTMEIKTGDYKGYLVVCLC